MENTLNKAANGVVYLTFPALSGTGLVDHAFSTRLGGVSRGVYGSMNLKATPGDPEENLQKNYALFCEAIGIRKESCVLSDQTHTTNVRRVGKADCGNGILRPKAFHDVDGMITDEPGVTLVTFYADCIPLWILDPVRKAVGLSHSGWKGTVGRIGAVTIEKMYEEFGSRAKDLICCIGPGICRDCFEVGEEVAGRFPGNVVRMRPARRGEEQKYDVDLLRANFEVFKAAGVREENIHISDFCTKCNPQLLFSHRVLGKERGSLAAFLALR